MSDSDIACPMASRIQTVLTSIDPCERRADEESGFFRKPVSTVIVPRLNRLGRFINEGAEHSLFVDGETADHEHRMHRPTVGHEMSA